MTTDDLSEIQLREQRRNAVIYKRELTKKSGGMMSADEVQALLGLPTPEAVLDAVSASEVFAVEDNGELNFPVFQFDEGKVRPGLIAVLKAAPQTSGWVLLQYLFRSEDGLAGDKPVEIIRGSEEDIERAVRFARRLKTWIWPAADSPLARSATLRVHLASACTGDGIVTDALCDGRGGGYEIARQ